MSRRAPEKVIKAHNLCDQPFQLNANNEPSNFSFSQDSKNKSLISAASKILARARYLSQEGFFLLRAYASLPNYIFENSEQAFYYLNNMTDLEYDKHCLCRSFFVAKTSRSFARSGVLFIGAFLPTFQMHAWIIDGTGQPDFTDRDWINYTPLLAFHIPSVPETP